MVVLEVAHAEQWKKYLDENKVLLSLECGLDEMLRACADSASIGRGRDPINFLAAWLMRHNPRHNPALLKHLDHLATVVYESKSQDCSTESLADVSQPVDTNTEGSPLEGASDEPAESADASDERGKTSAHAKAFQSSIDLRMTDGEVMTLQVHW